MVKAPTQVKVSVVVLAVCIGPLQLQAAEPAAPSPIAVIGDTEKICQVTGDTEWETNQPTAAKTMSSAGMDATDVGFPVEHAGKLILLFGDTWPSGHTPTSVADAEVHPDDAVGVTTRKDPPNKADGKCLELEIHHSSGDKKTFTPPTIVGQTPVKQGLFNVPSGGVSAGGGLYAFFWINHCLFANPLPPLPTTPLARPAPVAGKDCPETDDRNSVGAGMTARSEDDGKTFRHVVSMPFGFPISIAADTTQENDLPKDQRGIFVFSSPRYRAGVPYLAHAPAESFADPATWRFFTGRTAEGKPKWVTGGEWQRFGSKSGNAAEWNPPKEAEVFSASSEAERCIGELSITWNRPLKMWLMLYNCASTATVGAIKARIAPAPWGPWSEPTEILRSDDTKWACKLFMKPEGCGEQRDYWPTFKTNGKVVAGAPYGAYVLNRYTREEKGREPSATIYWLVSTWNPYQVVVMRSTLRLSKEPRAK